MSDRVNEAACPTCGSAVRVVGSNEGTMHYEATKRATAAVDVEQTAHHLHELGKYGDDFGGNNCDCTERARQIMRSIPLGYRLARLSGESE